jgi:NDP-sugar pyrophosphorylase family protein
MNDPALVVLAAGMGSRYGGLKQMDAMGPAGEWLLDYSVFDAYRAGFKEVVFVVRRFFEEDFRKAMAERLPPDLNWSTVVQEMDVLPRDCRVPDGRKKPLGTGHAIACARKAINRPFAVINADDYYGVEAYSVLADWLRGPGLNESSYALVAYDLGRTLSEHGYVSRGVCDSDGGTLLKVTEKTKLWKVEGGAENREENQEIEFFPADAPVSMNLWGFTPRIFDQLDEQLGAFLQNMRNPLKDEFYIPAAVDHLIQSGQAEVQVLRTQSDWFGVTYSEDKNNVRAQIMRLYKKKVYSNPLWINNE